MRVLSALYRQGWKRRLPHGVLSPRFLITGADENLRLHRRWWLTSAPQLPRPLWLLLELWLYLRWISCLAWIACGRVWRRRAADAAQIYGISPALLAWRLLRLALGSCIPPAQAWQLGLVSHDGHARRWQYIYGQELESFHAWCNRDLPQSKQAAAKLSDKFCLLDHLKNADVPLAEVCALLPAGSAEPEWSRFPSKLFLKPRYGSRSQACFICEVDGASVTWRHFKYKGSVAPQSAWAQQSARGDYLVMPYYGKPMVLNALSAGEEAVTLRIITVICTDGFKPLAAFVELAQSENGYVSVLLDLQSGQPQGRPIELQCAQWEAVGPYLRRMVDIATVAAARAHSYAVADYHAVAWDFVLTDDQPLLLEGNSHWGIPRLQEQAGLLAPDNDIGIALLQMGECDE